MNWAYNVELNSNFHGPNRPSRTQQVTHWKPTFSNESEGRTAEEQHRASTTVQLQSARPISGVGYYKVTLLHYSHKVQRLSPDTPHISSSSNTAAPPPCLLHRPPPAWKLSWNRDRKSIRSSSEKRWGAQPLDMFRNIVNVTEIPGIRGIQALSLYTYYINNLFTLKVRNSNYL